jgi:hypothetical protein
MSSMHIGVFFVSLAVAFQKQSEVETNVHDIRLDLISIPFQRPSMAAAMASLDLL